MPDVPHARIDHALDRPQHVVGDLDLLQEDLAALERGAAQHRLLDGDRLFEDLLEHEVLESRLLGHDGIDTRVLFFETAPPA